MDLATLETDAAAPVQNREDTLTEISQLAQLMREQKEAVDLADMALKKAKEDFRRTSQEDLPSLMDSVGLSLIKLSDGSSIEVKADVDCGIPAERQEEAFNWLEQHDFGGLIKTEVSISFGKMEIQDAQQLTEVLVHFGYPVEFSRGVHWQTLAAFLREQLAASAQISEENQVPLELFGARPIKVAKLKAVKKLGKLSN